MATALLYDDGCNFCKVIADLMLSWDRAGRMRPVAIQSPEGQRLLAPVPEARRLESFHLVEADGSIVSAGAALRRACELLPGAAPVGLLLQAAPGPTERSYFWVARHRIAISRLVPGALKRRASTRLAAAA